MIVPLLSTLVALAAPGDLERQFDGTVRPFVATYCLGCHGADKPKGQLDLTSFTDVRSVVEGLQRWERVLEVLTSKDMPPQKAKQQPGDETRTRVVAWIQALRQREAGRNPGDPGPVLARRLTNAEYDYTIRDLTGADIRPTRQFPVDPANQAGFDNSGESLVMSAPLLEKYLGAAQDVAEHLVLAPKRIAFAPAAVLTDTDRDEYAIMRIVRFYEQQPTDLARYCHAAWRVKRGGAVAAVAAEQKLSPGYLKQVWTALATREELGPLAKVQRMFEALPANDSGARAGCEQLRAYVTGIREKLSPKWKNLRLKSIGAGSQPFVLWKNTQQATHRRSFDDSRLYVATAPVPKHLSTETIKAVAALAQAVTHFSFRNIVHDSALPVPFGVYELADTLAPPDPELAIPDEASRPRYQAAFRRFCQVFPDAFYVAERARTFMDLPRDRGNIEAKGRFLAAGFQNMFGLFRDDLPLYQMILDDRGRRELDQLWRDLDFITQAAKRQHADFLSNARGERRTLRGAIYDFVRAEDTAATSQAMIGRLGEVYLASARKDLPPGADPLPIKVLEAFFDRVAANVGRVERERLAAEPAHRRSLLAFAARAYRRPLTAGERSAILAFYRGGRKHGLDHESAMRDTVTRVLMSPNFLYRVDQVTGTGVRPLDDWALASRLSYFLWSSMPDEELFAHARKQDLRRPAVLAAQLRRMLHHQRARALAVEFGGQWLDFRRFEEHNAVDRQQFPSFDHQLRQAMFEEPVRFLLDVIDKDRSVLDLLYARHTFVNGPLGRHYGMPAQSNDAWVRVDDADRYQRGGILPMAAFLTKNAPGLRTSPVKRGYWVVRRVLGERIPPPPAAVPDLPADERQLGKLTLREVLAKHREDRSCAGCHARFDAYGLALEGYGPVGELRSVDLGGRPVDATAFGPEGKGLEGLRAQIRAHRQDDFLDNLARKLFSYALGRGLMLSDESAIQEMKRRIAAQGPRFSVLVTSIVNSRQFLTMRTGEYLASGRD